MKYTFLFLLIFLFSCTNSNKQETTQPQKDLSKMSLEEILEVPMTFSEKEYTLEKVREINILIDSVSENWSVYPIYHDTDTTQYYIQGNGAINSIDFYDLDTKKLAKRILFPRLGTETVMPLTDGIYIINKDSIYVYQRYRGSVVHINIDGKIIKRYNFPNEFIGIPTGLYASMSSNFFVKDDSAYFANGFPMGKNNRLNHKIINVFSLQDEKMNALSSTIPMSIADETTITSDAGLSRTINDNIFLDIVDITGQIRYTNDKINYKHTILQRRNLDKSNLKSMKQGDNGIVYDCHFQVLHDKENKLFYLAILEGMDEKDINGKENSYDDKPITIVIADENFHHAGEITLPKDTHFRNIMVTRDGLLVSNANPKNPNNDESVLSFTLYKPKKIK